MSPRIRRRRVVSEALAPYILDVEPPYAVLDWGEVFGVSRPVELEIGFGKGRFLLAASSGHPDRSFVGVEISQSLVEIAAERLRLRNLVNARVVRGDAASFLKSAVPPGSLAAVHFYFPDPWWKKRHRKRRVFTPELFEAIVQALLPGGLLHMASDVPFVFEEMAMLAAMRSELARDEIPAALCTTNFEDKALRDGRPVQRASFKR